ncbi:MAG: FAD-dependent oxidoreductase [Vicinamibacterales bacterium]
MGTTPSSLAIVGAGVAGLTIAHQLSRRGRPVTVLERDDVVGGLARTFHYGPFHFDVGPHRFHTDNPRVEAFIREVLGGQAIEIRRTSGARMFGRFHDWPLRASVLRAMPVSVMATSTRDLLLRPRHPGESFEADVLNKYGRTLYEIFFRPYTRKFLFYGPEALHRDWARAGVNRAVIDQRASADTLWSLLRTTLLPKPVDTTFLYTPDGVGRFPDTLASRIVAAGGEVATGAKVTGLEISGDRVVSVSAGDRTTRCDGLVWTGPLPELNRLLGLPAFDLEYLSTVFYHFEIHGPARLPYQWTYFGGDEVFSRVTVPTAFAETMAPRGQSGLTVEVTCREGDDRWRAPHAGVDRIVADLVRTGVLESAADIGRVHVEPVRNTYPIYKLNYLEELKANLRALARFENVLVAGRCGRFWYNNMDHSIGQALTMADRILAGDVLAAIDDGPREFWAPSDGKTTA